MTQSRSNTFLIAVAALVMLLALYMIFLYAPTEKEMGHVQRIFYFHVPAAWTAMLAYIFVFAFSFAYLMKGHKKWDSRAAACAEVGVLFNSINLITGPIWAKPVWGIWWTWDARLTLTLVMWLIYVSYLMLRHYVTDPERRATFSAVVGILGFIDVPIVYFSIRWWRGQHPKPVVAGGPESGLDPAMWTTLYVSLAAFLLLFLVLVRQRLWLQRMRDELDAIRQRVETV